MQTKRNEQPTFFDLAVQQRGASNRVLETIAREVDFSEAEARVAATYGQGGRPATRVGVLLRVMILQHLYGLSDPQAETQINDRLSFQKFLQLDTHEVVPDETTICRFRQRLIECGLHEQLLALLNTQLEARGYLVNRTTLVDATLVESSRQRPATELAASGHAPDAEASDTRKGGHTFYGYNAGTDVFVGDKLGGLSLTAEEVLQRDLFVIRQFQQHRIPFVMLLSGGYSQESHRLVANTVASLLRQEMRDGAPHSEKKES